jgi:transcriptional regulator with XRE-family HTH domain
MEARSLPEALKLIKAQRGCSQMRLAADLDMSQSFLSRLIAGKTDITVTSAIQRLSSVGWELRITPRVEDDDPVKRREFVAAAASVVFVPSSKSSPYKDAAYVRMLSERLARSRYELGGVPLASTAIEHARRIWKTVDNTSDSELQTAASRLADQASLALYDARQLTAAAHSGAMALEFSRRAGDLDGQATAYDTLSRISSYKGDHLRGVRYARQGLELADLSESQRAFLNMRLGRSLARIRDQERASRDAFERALTASGLSPLGRAAMIGDVGIGLGLLQEFSEADLLLEQAADLMGQWSPLFQAQYLGRQVQTALNAADPNMAADRILMLARAAPLVRSSRLDMRIAEILKVSKHWSHVREVHEAREQLEEVALPRIKPSG